MNRARKISGFTLIEILIVVIILGILAAIVIPQFTNASTQAKQSSLASELQTLKTQIAEYKLQHNDTAPLTAAALWDDLTVASDAQGDTGSSIPAGAQTYGPYFEAAVNNPLAISASTPSQVGSTSAPAAGDAWEYNSATGKVYAVIPDPTGSSANGVITEDGTTVSADSW